MKRNLFRSVWLIGLLSLMTLVTAHAQQILVPENSIWGLSWRPDGSQIAFGLYDGTVQIVSSISGETTRILQSGQTAWIVSLAWSPDGTKIAGSNNATAVFIWDAASGQLIRTLTGQNQFEVFGLVWSPDSSRVAGVSPLEFLLQIWDVNTGQILGFQRGIQSSIDWFQNRIAAGSGNSVITFNAETLNDAQEIGLRGAYSVDVVTWSSDGVYIASADSSSAVNIWDANPILPVIDVIPIYNLIGHTLPVTALDWNPIYHQLASASYDGSVKIWNLDTGQLERSIEAGGMVLNVQWSPDGTRLAYSGDVAALGGTIKLVDIVTLTPTPTFTPPPTATLTFTPTPAAYQRLRLTSVCSADPALTRRWRVRNSNPYDVAFTWDVYGTAQTGSGVAPAAQGSTPGEAFFETQTAAGTPNTTRLAVNGVQQDVKASGGAACP